MLFVEKKNTKAEILGQARNDKAYQFHSFFYDVSRWHPSKWKRSYFRIR